MQTHTEVSLNAIYNTHSMIKCKTPQSAEILKNIQTYFQTPSQAAEAIDSHERSIPVSELNILCLHHARDGPFK